MQTERTVFTVSQLNNEVSQLLTHGFPALWVEGEISNLANPSSGHLYLTLKDAGAQVRCAMFRNRVMSLKIRPANGMKVLVRGKVGLYEPRGEFQMVIEQMEDAGVGALQRQFEELKRKLQAQGLFADAHKKPLPAFPRCIGVITSPTGAAIRDILHVLKRRCPQIPVIVYPVAVQGEGSKEQIVRAIQQAGREARCDVLILARGGGSIEDLWSFNEESVAQAIYACPLPIVSGVGHEVDFTIADFVADVRAPTPSAAAELVGPEMAIRQTQVQRLYAQLQRIQQRRQQQAAERLTRLQKRLENQRPTNRLQQKAQRLDELEMRLQAAARRYYQRRADKLQTLTLHWQTAIPRYLARRHDKLQIQAGKLHALSPLAVLERGYGITKCVETGHVVRNVDTLRLGQTVSTQISTGHFESIVTKIQKADAQCST
jgi:exodeoxyribonuclease VII large subunit